MKYIDYASVKIISLSLLGLVALPYWFYSGGTLLGLIAIRMIAKFLQTCGTIGYHRWLCHNSFKPSIAGKYLMLTGMILNSVGRPLHVVVAHRAHHAHSDQLGDPHSPKHNGFWNLWLGRFQLSSGNPSFKDFFRNREAVWVNQHYWKLWWGINGTIAVIDLPTALLISPVNFLIGWFGSTYINYYGHNARDKNDLRPTNLSRMFSVVSFGEELHGNHHQNPSSYHFNGNGRTDLSKRLIETILMHPQTRLSQPLMI
jgi:fatty-acid desaturase